MGVAVLVSLTAYIIEGRIPTLILFGSVLALVFGSLTLFFHDETFIKVRPTITFSLLGSVLLGGLAFGRIFLRSLFEYAFQIDEAGWRKLTTRIAVWFFVLAIANHLVWTNFSAEFWAGYKLFAVPAMMLAFMALQAPLLLRHQLPGANAENQGSEQAPD
jgi:intracellular septation protein